MPKRYPLAPCALALALAACDGGGTGPIPDATGTVTGVVYIDRNGDGQLNAELDGPASSVRVSLTPAAGGPTTRSSVTDQTGLYRMTLVPVGSYRVQVDAASLGDTLRLAKVDSATLTVTANAETGTRVALEVVPLTIERARQAEVGRLLTVEAIALNGGATFSDSTVHIADTGGTAMRLISFAAAQLAAGDSVRVLARLTTRDGQPVLDGATVFRRGKAAPVTPVLLSTRVAATGDGGRRDAALVRVQNAVVRDTATVARGLRLTVDDGSGPLTVLVDRQSNIAPNPPFIPGASVDLTGVLAATGAGTWQLRPRNSEDVAVRYPRTSIEQARRQPAGSSVIIEGVALSTWAVFGDSSLHVADNSASLRVLRLPQTTVSVGDSLRVVGTVQVQAGQPALINASLTRLGTANQSPEPVRVSTGVAARADGGRLDAALVRIDSALVTNSVSVTPAGDGRVIVNDGSGSFDVILDRDAQFGLDQPLLPGALLSVRGVLVPAGDGTSRWQLKPRGTPDLRLEYPFFRIDQARRQPAGTVMTIEGVALNSWYTFGDSSVHVSDPSGTLRVVRVPEVSLAAGDSVRLIGKLTATRTGQLVLDASQVLQARLLGKAQRVPTPVVVTPTEAATARNGTLDGALVRLENAVVRDTASSENGDFSMQVGDSATGVWVVLDANTSLATTTYAPGARLNVVGLLVPSNVSRVWVLKPRAPEDLSVQ